MSRTGMAGLMAMSQAARIHLVGGGADSPNAADLVRPFTAEAIRHAARNRPRTRIALLLADDGRADQFRPAYTAALDAHGDGTFEYFDMRLDAETHQDPSIFDHVDGIVVGGGPTALYSAGLEPLSDGIQSAIGTGVPYLGFSAGAMIAPSAALLGGWRDRHRAVCGEDWSEGFGELMIAGGLGLTNFTVDVHATQAGLLSRAIAAALRPGVGPVAALDENTALIVPAGATTIDGGTILGEGFVWWIAAAADGTVTAHRVAGDRW